MATYTENYNLVKPDDTDYYSVSDFNENMDIIDAQLAANEVIEEKIDAVSDSLFEVETSFIIEVLMLLS